jgi:hypothetical protein
VTSTVYPMNADAILTEVNNDLRLSDRSSSWCKWRARRWKDRCGVGLLKSFETGGSFVVEDHFGRSVLCVRKCPTLPIQSTS